MVRSFVFLLLLIVVFLGGMLLGIDREKSAGFRDMEHPNTEDVGVIDYTDHMDKDTRPIDQLDVEKPNNEQIVEAPPQTTQKVASFLETGVKGFYDMVVDILYHVSSLFV